MPVAPTYPGVYVEEVPSGVHAIAGVPTAVAAFVGWFPKGTMNTAVEVLSFADVEREFGGLHKDSETSFALSQYFLNGGGRGWVVRVAAPGSGDTALNTANNNVPSSGGTAFGVKALNEGAWGNSIRVQVIGPNSDDRFDLLVSLVGTQGGRAVVLQQERFRGLTVGDDTDPSYLPLAVNGLSRLITIPDGTYAVPAPSGAAGNAPFTSLTAGSHVVNVTIGSTTEAITLVNTADITTAETMAEVLQSAVRTARGADPAWAQAVVVAHDDGKLQLLPGVGVGDGVQLSDVDTNGDGTADDTTSSADLHMPTSPSDGSVALAGGGDGDHPGATELIGSAVGEGSGMFALENTDFTLLCLPSIANQKSSDTDGLSGGTGYSTVVANAITYCRHKRAMLLLDPPDTVTGPASLKTWLASNSSVRDEYSALYFPRVSVLDPTRNFVQRSVGPSGTVAGLMARVDNNRGVWKAPAGTEATLRGLQTLDYDLTDPENGTLNPIAVNCLRTFDAYGTVCWGARTLAGSDAATSEYKYVPIRRLANFLESSLTIGLQWVVFEPNDEPLWSQIRLNIGSFLHGLFRQGAFAGRAPRDAYLVKCDSSTTTSEDQALGVVNVLVGFAPLRPAEFVVLRIQQLAGQTQS